ncbi:MAG: hypothetical protein JO340_06915 [Acidobacteriaceae bacterium]|nr:hypothetical protein [Acidobacteriaceae bacterium]
MQPVARRSWSGRLWTRSRSYGVLLALALAAGPASQAHARQAKSALTERSCSGDDFIDEVLRSMPQGYEIPCDRVVVVKDFGAFLRGMPDLRAKPELVAKAHRSIAFTINATWPIYFNFDQYKLLAETHTRTRQDAILWMMVVVSGHELTHAMGDADESDALLTELSLLSRFMHEGKIPADFNIDFKELKQQFVRAIKTEDRSKTSPRDQ